MLDCPVDKFLFQSLQQENPSLKHFITQSEASIRAFCANETQYELAFPPLNSFHRRCIHCLGRLYGLQRAVEETNLFNAESTIRSMSLSKPENYSIKSVPILKCSDLIEPASEQINFNVEAIIAEKSTEVTPIESGNTSSNETSNTTTKDTAATSADTNTAPNTNTSPNTTTTPGTNPTTITNITSNDPVVVPSSAAPKIKILKRATSSANTTDTTASITLSSSTPASNASIQEREVLYQAARERIFKDFPSTELNSTTAASSKLNPNAQTFTLPALNQPPQSSSEPITFTHIFTFTIQKPLNRTEMHTFCQEAEASARLFEFPVREGFLIGKVIESEVLAKWEIEATPFTATQIYE